jgi:hypothetical protein
MKRYNFTNPLFLFKIESMMRRIFFLMSLLILVACDDGDILTVELAFDQDLDRCDNDVASYLIYDTRSDPNESLTLLIPKSEQTNAFFINPTIDSLSINGSTVRFNYRTYNTNPAGSLCDVLSNPDLVITENYEADTGTVYITSTIVDDDNDGIPSIDEYGPGGLADPRDSDGDGIADYLDQDDDNDNVLTRNEIIILSGSNPPYSLINTDGDEFPDYLDPDDDNDDIDTILEDENGSNGPFDDEFINAEGVFVKRYLSVESTESYANPGNIANTYTRVVSTRFRVEDVNLQILRSTVIDLGTFISTYTITQQ